ncbi:MAG: hypothetical protein K5790_05030 [Nitrosopumilus sp.]|uniref:hypothetical protein n=1 Tax=Nitrosopumilus sp. TaxID=2024843 RepID=UPI00247EC062|nr:hypothetical protein [Nitrosopumilus sp.]MCV0392643.1 hypothetical protein [Nitrosopumilus sp.]
MKIIFLVFLVLFTITPVYAQLLSDSTGLVNRLDVDVGGHSFEIETVSNFDITKYDFNAEQKKLTLYINSGLEKSLADIQIPRGLLSGNFTFFLNDQELFPKVRNNDKISFVTMNFTGIGNHTLAIFGTTILNEMDDVSENDVTEPENSIKNDAEIIDSTAWLVTAIVITIAAILLIIILKNRK